MKLNKVKLNRQNIFLILLAAMVAAGKVIPFRDGYNQYFNLSAFIDWGIAAIFLLYGLKLNIREIVKDISNWKLHLLVQLGTFVIFPLLVLPFYGLAKDTEYFVTWLSVFFLASLPSTVSSSVVMVSIAKGNVTSAIFNASVSGIIGIVMTPLLMSFFIQPGQEDMDNAEIIQQLLLKVLLPIILGVILNPLFKHMVARYSKLIAEFDKLIILLIVYESFSKAFTENVFASVEPRVFLIIAGSVTGLFFLVYHILRYLAGKLDFKREDVITATFCGSKKSLVHGSLFVMVLGIAEDQKVLFLLPVMIYHSFQLFYVSWLANRLEKKAVVPRASAT